MADEPGGWELRRGLEDIGRRVDAGFDSINKRIDRLVTTETLLRVEKGFEEKLAEQAKDIEQVRGEQAEHRAKSEKDAEGKRSRDAIIAAAMIAAIASIIVSLIGLLAR